jgi:hypothetical protein
MEKNQKKKKKQTSPNKMAQVAAQKVGMALFISLFLSCLKSFSIEHGLIIHDSSIMMIVVNRRVAVVARQWPHQR